VTYAEETDERRPERPVLSQVSHMTTAPTVPPPRPATLSSSLRRNIESLAERRRQEAASATVQERLAQAITAFTGSMTFVYLHLALYGA
jgi:hypothetical protein